MLNVTIFCYAEYCYAEYCYAECHYAECHNAECHNADCHNAECRVTIWRTEPLPMLPVHVFVVPHRDRRVDVWPSCLL